MNMMEIAVMAALEVKLELKVEATVYVSGLPCYGHGW